jgi:hypothetical protein
MIKNFALFIISFLLLSPLKAQWNMNKKEKKVLYYFNGGIGYYLPLSAGSFLSEKGTTSSFQFQVDYKNHLFGRFYFDQYNVAFHTKFMQNGGNTYINGKVQTTALGLDVGYSWHVHRLSPYAYVGTGLAMTDVPFLQNNTPGTNDAILTTESRSSLAFRAGVGMNYKINRFFIIYIEPQFLSFPIKTQVYDGMLNGVSVQLGFKTPLQ